ncbi:PEPxxWA-CTERM sorting domain-containing protein [Erythrobacter sp. 3-20A1M]|uniref:PEPxxWA-CTERM sorting domain-containing protein n=1 Tax=Erythrobacter sp. 3-20A1M TaxID=2653850 RepID=UPI00203DD4EC|nr:PEPxxWA-CTERM sorting domain-containing protein [Erythrobacter sp. 3-20A1M]
MKLAYAVAPTSLFALVGMAGPASAATTVDVDYAPTVDGTPITIGGAAAPQYTFKLDVPTPDEFGGAGPTKTRIYANGNAKIGSPGEPANYSSVETNLGFGYGGDGIPFPIYTNGEFSLRFDIGDTRYSGTATVDGAGNHISQISYEALGAGGVPEPATWALMILGMGAAGAAMRRRNQVAPRPAIA